MTRQLTLLALGVCAIVGALLTMPAANAGELEARYGADVVRISDAPCTDPGVAAVESSEVYAQMHAAWASVGGTRFMGCWRMAPGGAVYLRYEDGDQGLIPQGDFHEPRVA